MEKIERRQTARHAVRFSLTFKTTSNRKGPKFGELLDISPFGARFSTRSTIREGEQVEISLKLPKEIMGDLPQLHWLARVVDVQSAQGNGGIEVRVKLLTWSEIAH